MLPRPEMQRCHAQQSRPPFHLPSLGIDRNLVHYTSLLHELSGAPALSQAGVCFPQWVYPMLSLGSATSQPQLRWAHKLQEQKKKTKISIPSSPICDRPFFGCAPFIGLTLVCKTKVGSSLGVRATLGLCARGELWFLKEDFSF